MHCQLSPSAYGAYFVEVLTRGALPAAPTLPPQQFNESLRAALQSAQRQGLPPTAPVCSTEAMDGAMVNKVSLRRHSVWRSCGQCSQAPGTRYYPPHEEWLCPECLATQSTVVPARDLGSRGDTAEPAADGGLRVPGAASPPPYAPPPRTAVATTPSSTTMRASAPPSPPPAAQYHASLAEPAVRRTSRVPVMVGGVVHSLTVWEFIELLKRLLPDVTLFNVEPLRMAIAPKKRRKTGLYTVWVDANDARKLFGWHRRCFYDIDRMWYATTKDEEDALAVEEMKEIKAKEENTHPNGTQRPVHLMTVEAPDKWLHEPKKWKDPPAPPSSVPQREPQPRKTEPRSLPCPCIVYETLTRGLNTVASDDAAAAA